MENALLEVYLTTMLQKNFPFFATKLFQSRILVLIFNKEEKANYVKVFYN